MFLHNLAWAAKASEWAGDEVNGRGHVVPITVEAKEAWCLTKHVMTGRRGPQEEEMHHLEFEFQM